MNNTRRKQLKEITAEIEEAIERIRFLQEEEEQAFENLPDGIKESERGQQMEDAAYTLESAADDIENAINELLEL